MRNQQPIVYIMTNKRNGTLYTGVTSDLIKRVYEHKHSVVPGFTKTYHCNLLVYFEQHGNIQEAIKREKQIKSCSRKKKLSLIETLNPDWEDLYKSLL